MQPGHRNSEASARCILFFVVALFGVSGAKPAELLGFGDMHLVFHCGLAWRDDSQTIGIPSVCRDASVFFVVVLIGVTGTKPWNS